MKTEIKNSIGKQLEMENWNPYQGFFGGFFWQKIIKQCAEWPICTLSENPVGILMYHRLL